MARNFEDYAIVIGINEYSKAWSDPLSDLKAAELDAKAFIRWLLDETGGGLPEENIHPLLASAPERNTTVFPEQRDVDRVLYSLLGNNRPSFSDTERVGRRLYIFFAGHGVANEVDDLVMQLAGATRSMSNYGLSLRKYRNSLVESALFEEVVFILDCCRTSKHGVEGYRPGYDTGVRAARSRSVRAVTIFATGDGLRAREAPIDRESPERRYGLLTLALLSALQGGASDDEDCVTTDTLKKYLRAAVRELSELAGLKEIQEPGMLCEVDLSVCTVAYRPAQLTVYAAELAQSPEVLDHKGAPVPPIACQPAGPVWSYTLPKLGLYEIRQAGVDKPLLLQVIPGWEYTVSLGRLGQPDAWIVERRVIPPLLRNWGEDSRPTPDRNSSRPGHSAQRLRRPRPGGVIRRQGPRSPASM